MAHKVETMAYHGAVPWHGLGRKVENVMTAAEAINAAGLNWSVGLCPLQTVEGGIPVPGWSATVRDSDRRVLGVVGDGYKILQNREAFGFFDRIVAEGKAIYHTAGSLWGGRRVWLLAKLPGEIRVVGDDVVDKYLLLANGHDGTYAVHALWTPVRVVCNNTLNSATRAEDRHARIIHYGDDFEKRVEQAYEILGLAGEVYERMAERWRFLAGKQVVAAQVKAAAEQMFPLPDGETVARGTVRENRLDVNRLFLYGKGNDLPGVRGTAWALYNALTEWSDHERRMVGKGEQAASNRMNSIMSGRGADFKVRALDVVTELVTAGVA